MVFFTSPWFVSIAFMNFWSTIFMNYSYFSRIMARTSSKLFSIIFFTLSVLFLLALMLLAATLLLSKSYEIIFLVAAMAYWNYFSTVRYAFLMTFTSCWLCLPSLSNGYLAGCTRRRSNEFCMWSNSTWLAPLCALRTPHRPLRSPCAGEMAISSSLHVCVTYFLLPYASPLLRSFIFIHPSLSTWAAQYLVFSDSESSCWVAEFLFDYC